MTQDQTRHIAIGDLSLRLSLVADALGIPAATLERLASGEWVAVPIAGNEIILQAIEERVNIALRPDESGEGYRLRDGGAASVWRYVMQELASATEAGSHDD